MPCCFCYVFLLCCFHFIETRGAHSAGPQHSDTSAGSPGIKSQFARWLDGSGDMKFSLVRQAGVGKKREEQINEKLRFFFFCKNDLEIMQNQATNYPNRSEIGPKSINNRSQITPVSYMRVSVQGFACEC